MPERCADCPDPERFPSFDSAETLFSEFAAGQGYPPELFWTASDRLLFWCGRLFALTTDAQQLRREAKAAYDDAASRHLGLALEARCRTHRISLCRVYVPRDESDARARLIPPHEVKFSVAAESHSVVLVRNRALWWLIEWACRKSIRPWD